MRSNRIPTICGGSGLQAPGRADPGQAAQQQSEVAAGRLDEHPLADILMAAAHPHAAQTAGLVRVRERPFPQAGRRQAWASARAPRVCAGAWVRSAGLPYSTPAGTAIRTVG